MSNEGTLVLDFHVPTTWPPAADTYVHDGTFDGYAFLISASPRGTLTFDLHGENYHVTYETPILILPDFAFLKTAFLWGGGESVGCAINGDMVSEMTHFPIELKADSQPPTGFRRPVTFAVPTDCGDVGRSFLRFILDLQARIAANDRFNLLEASAILRRLLLDASPVLHLANREHRRKLFFPFVPERLTSVSGTQPTFQFINLCPFFADPLKIQKLNLQEFLATPVIRDHERAFTVHNVIDVCANLKGGIHFGKPVSQMDKSLITLDKNFLPFFLDASLAALPGIAWTTICGSTPLIEAILNQATPPI